MKKVERKNYTVRIHREVDEEKLKTETIKFVKGVIESGETMGKQESSDSWETKHSTV